MRWNGRIRKDLRDRRWQTGSLSSLSRTSRKLLLVLLSDSKWVRRVGNSGPQGRHVEWRHTGMFVGQGRMVRSNDMGLRPNGPGPAIWKALGLEITERTQKMCSGDSTLDQGLEVWVQGHYQAHIGTERGSGLTAEFGRCVPGRSGW